jgi:hypothetical protein
MPWMTMLLAPESSLATWLSAVMRRFGMVTSLALVVSRGGGAQLFPVAR